MLAKLLLLFTIVPALELAVLIAIGQRIGLLPTLVLILSTGFVGAWLARREGLRTWREFQTTWTGGRMPGDTLLHGVIILLGGALLLTPGVLTDLIGLGLLVPASRRAVVQALKRKLRDRLLVRHGPIS